METIIEIRNLDKSYGKTQVLFEINLVVHRASAWAL